MHHDCRRKVGFVPHMTIVLGAALVTSACSHSRNAAAQWAASRETHALATNLSPVLSMHDVMTHVFQYSADNVWRRLGRIYTRDAVVSLFPKDEEEWEEAEEASATLAELTNVLLLPTRMPDDKIWAGFVDELRQASIEAMQSAEAHAEESFFHAGGRIQAACEACHDRYLAAAR